ncbi:FAD-dependent oxidoreductase [Gordonia sp. ABSL1-1]|uniref:NAD(P)/FAD-dependent oxidoreductase n=1 Tax=Gordonia sp. ABSL1-1 TaxID=3053923 RepID=UPI0025727B14|nr:FAD-dependent oxidoreductase [Gordonia sp. ABSL1-1]MDL9935733.1 FAD-dependent oxidoreductase [Gordonia sp. ABSL1-1]
MTFTSPAGRVVVIGTGIAGMTAAEALRTSGFTGPITLIGEEPDLPYRRTALSKNLASADLSAETLTLRKRDFWWDRDIVIRTGTEITAIDPGRRQIVADGEDIGYDALILATGGTPLRFPWMSPGVATLRTRADAVAIGAALRSGQPLIVIGGGLIGSELAASAATAGGDVTVLEAQDRPMSRVLPAPVADLLTAQHRHHGVSVHTRAVVTSADADRVDGDGFDTAAHGFVVAALGITPNTGLAARAGIEVGPDGIHTDAQLRTSAERVYAAGDVAAPPHPLTGQPRHCEQWMTAAEQGKVAAATIMRDLGAAVEIPALPIPLAWTVQYGINIQIAGWPTAGDRIVIDGSLTDLDAGVRVYAGDGLIGAVSVGRPADGRRYRAEIADTVAAARQGEPISLSG